MAIMPDVHAHQFLVSAGHDLATLAAFEILDAGGNAIDAGVAGVLTLGVVMSDQVSIAGVAPMLIHLADTGEDLTITGLGHWSRSIDAQAYIERFNGQIPLGAARSVVPAAPDAVIQALQRYGTMSFSDVAARAIRCAAEGFPMHQTMLDYLNDYRDDLEQFEHNRQIFMPDGRFPHLGERFVQSDLAATLQFLCDQEKAAASKGREAGLQAVREAFYKGDLAQTILRYYAEQEGFLTAQDFAEFRCQILPPAARSFAFGGKEFEVLTCGAWCQGPTLLEALAIAEQASLAGPLEPQSAAYFHTIAELLKLSFADREAYLGDPDFVQYPLDTLISAAYAKQRYERIDSELACPGLPMPGTIDGVEAYFAPEMVPLRGDRAAADTSVVTVIDRDGNCFSSNPSDPSWDVPIVPGTGLAVSSRGSQSWAVKGHPSVLAPGKRPRLTPNPCLARAKGEWVMPFATPGGDTQVQGNLQFLLNHLLFDMPVQDAIEAPRVITHSQPNSFAPHTSQPGRLFVESRIDQKVSDRLAELGHDVERGPAWTHKTSAVCAVKKDLNSGLLTGGADQRRPSRAMGW